MAIEGLNDNQVSTERQQQQQQQQQEQSQQPQQQVQVCVKNCGFFGNPSTLNMCSTCYRTHMALQETTATTSNNSAVDLNSARELGSSSESSAAATTIAGSEVVADVPVLPVVLKPAVQSPASHKTPTTSVTPSKRPAVPLSEDCLAHHPAARHCSSSHATSVTLLSSSSTKSSADFASTFTALPSSSSSSSRCHVCRKKLGLTGFGCRCHGVFCAVHRYSDRHNCSFDYKTAGREAIAKASPVVKADKVQRF